MFFDLSCGLIQIVEVLKLVSASWAFSTAFFSAVVIVVFLFLFRSQISGLISRIRAIGKKGIDIGDHQERQTPPMTDPRKAADDILTQLNVNQYYLAQQEMVKKELEQRNLPIDSDTARVLLSYTGALFIALDFERIYSSIWGSQISILNFLNTRISAGRTEIQPYYEVGETLYPEVFKTYPFEKYIAFLVSQGLVQQDAEVYTITLKGRTFLLYLVNQGLNQNKAG